MVAKTCCTNNSLSSERIETPEYEENITPDIAMPTDDSDSDIEELAFAQPVNVDDDSPDSRPEGYMPLRMDDDETEDAFVNDNDDDSSSIEDIVDTDRQALNVNGELPAPVCTIIPDVWNETTAVSMIEMDDERVDAVKLAMQNITIPPVNIPDWAHSIPEEQWKDKLLHRLSQTK